MEQISNTEFRAQLGPQLERVHHQRVRLTIIRRGKPLAAVVPTEDLELLERLEDKLEERWASEKARQALAEGGEPIPAESVWSDLGL